MEQVKIIIIGAGAAGIGVGTAFKNLGVKDFMILEASQIGASFLNWPKETRFITPSFTTNGFGFPDINAVVPNTSPAYTFEKEHLSGEEYAQYLSLVAENFDLPILEGTRVLKINSHQGQYLLETNKGQYVAQYVVVAVGEFQNPYDGGIVGSSHAIHYGNLDTFDMTQAGEWVVVGGNESGVDAFVNLAQRGQNVSLVTSSFGPSETSPDPSVSLAPVTKERLSETLKRYPKVKIIKDRRLVSIDKQTNQYLLTFNNGQTMRTDNPPILGTGFRTCVTSIEGESLFEYNESGVPIVTINDESTIAPNVFLVGPSLRHSQAILCYIYKFRQRFAPLVVNIAQREGLILDESALQVYRQNNMYLDDLSCCHVSCTC